MDINIKDFDYVRLTICDIHGVARSRVYSTRHWDSILTKRALMCEGILALLPNGDLVDLPEVGEKQGNVILQPRADSVYTVTWQQTGKKVCEVFCDMLRIPSMLAYPVSSMMIAQKQIQRLGELGFKLKGAFECEFVLCRDTSVLPTPGWMSSLHFAMEEKFFFELDEALFKAGVNIESMHAEMGLGMFECTFNPEIGIKSADNVFIFRQALKEKVRREGAAVTTMSMIPTSREGNSLHFNHSLLDQAGNNILSNVQGSYHLSKVAEWWLGGLVKHGRGSTALMLPTVSCYRRLGEIHEPTKVNWGVEDRSAGIRVRNYNINNIYFETRLPGGCANSYLVLAATIAAGIDGLQNKIPLPIESDHNCELYPRSLGEALDEFRKDQCMVECFGEMFVDWFCRVKEAEIDLLQKSKEENGGKKKDIELEWDMYQTIF